MSLDCLFGFGLKQEALPTEALPSIIPAGNTIFLTSFVEKLLFPSVKVAGSHRLAEENRTWIKNKR